MREKAHRGNTFGILLFCVCVYMHVWPGVHSSTLVGPVTSLYIGRLNVHWTRGIDRSTDSAYDER